jgi:hypothetical protein
MALKSLVVMHAAASSLGGMNLDAFRFNSSTSFAQNSFWTQSSGFAA